MLHPPKTHPPMPFALMQALVGVSIAWGWHRMGMSLLLGFFGLLRPCEILLLQVRDIILQTSNGAVSHVMMVIRSAKTRLRGARHQYVMTDDFAIARFLPVVLRSLNPYEFIFPGSAWSFRKRLRALLKSICGNADLLLPSSLCCATYVQCISRRSAAIDVAWTMALCEDAQSLHLKMWDD